MSLINEALKRASLNQAKPPEAPPPEVGMSPAEHEPVGRRRWVWAAVAAMGVLGLSGLFFGLNRSPKQAARPSAASRLVVAANTSRAPVAGAPRLSPSAASPAPAKLAGLAVPAPVAARAPAVAAVPVKSTLPPARTNPPAAALARSAPATIPSPSPAQKPARVESVRAGPAPAGSVAAPKLQAIFYRPSNPSAMINGSTFFCGDEFQGVKVLAIDQQRVTVQWKGQTRVLTLR